MAKTLHKIDCLQNAAVYFGISGAIFLLIFITVYFRREIRKKIVAMGKERKEKRKQRMLLLGTAMIFFAGIEVRAEERIVSVPSRPDSSREAQIVLKGMGKTAEEGGILYYDQGVQGMLSVQEEYLDREKVEIYAIPQDWEERKNIVPDGSVDIVDKRGWERIWLWIDSGNGEIKFSFTKQGKWLLFFQSERFHVASRPFVIDRTAPRLNVSYVQKKGISSAVSSPNSLQQEINRDLRRITSPECEVFSSKGGRVDIQITEDYLDIDEIKVKITEHYYDGRKPSLIEGKTIIEKNWIQQKNTAVLQLAFDREGHFKIQVEYEDKLGHQLTAIKESETARCMKEGKYEGPMYTVDDTPPTLRAFTFLQKEEGKDNHFTAPPEIMLEVEEENFNQQDFYFDNVATWADGSLICPRLSSKDYYLVWTSHYEEGKRVNCAILKMDREANYAFCGKVTDGAGLSSVVQKGNCVYDQTEPEVQVSLSGAERLPYLTYPYFSQEGVTICIQATDLISGVRAIRYRYVDHQQQKEEEQQIDNHGEEGNSKMTWNVYLTREKDFKGKIIVQAEDAMGKKSLWKEGPGMIVESKEKHAKEVKLAVNVSAPDFMDEKKKIKYYRHKAVVSTEGENGYAGLRSLSLSAEARGKKQQKKKENYGDKEELTQAEEIRMEIKAEDFPETSRENPVQIKSVLVDNAGHQTVRKYEEYKIVMDGCKPQITVRYNTNHASHGRYYNQTRVAAVTIKDWNFNPEAVEWMITGSNQNYEIGEWTGKGEIHQCLVRFLGEGEEYKIKLAATDYAGNRSCWDEDKPFIIDKTPPQVKMKMNRKAMKNGKYYKTPQSVFIQVYEKHLDKDMAGYRVKEGDKKKRRDGMFREEKRKNKDQYFFTARFDRDGQYQVNFRCRDLAGNRSPALRAYKFILDQEKPEIQLNGVEKGMSYKGKIAPEVIVKDIHLNTDKIQAVIERIDGGNLREPLAEKGRKQIKPHKEKIIWKDFPRKKNVDGIYRLTAVAEDLAGNSCSLGKGVPFTINRFGASFQIFQCKEGKREPLDKKYKRREGDIVIRETSVIPTDIRIRLLKDNQTREEIIPVSTPRQRKNKKGWSIREHRIDQRYFQEEGTYQITAYSSGYVIRQGRKNIIKETSNDLRGKSIRFTIDKTPPVVEISGLEDRVYVKKKHAFMIRALDNFEVSHLKVYIHPVRGRQRDKILHIRGDELGETHSITETLTADEGKQEVWIRAWDKAGNCTDSREQKAGEKTGIICMVTEKEKKAVKGIQDKDKIFWPERKTSVNGEGLAALFLTASLLVAVVWLRYKF